MAETHAVMEETPAQRPWRGRADLLAIGVLIALTAIIMAHRWVFDDWLSRHDLLAFFIPWYGYLGDRLAAGDIPGWNPYLFGGTSMAGDPESGWMYFPAMITFTVLPVLTAMKALVLMQLLIAGTATFALGRTLGLGTLAALLSAVVYEFGPMLYVQTDCCTVSSHLSTWIPVALLGVELSLRARRWVFRAAWWSLAGLAISQMLAGWVGQGSLYGVLLVSAYIGVRTVIIPAVDWTLAESFLQAIANGFAINVIGVGIAAAGLLPRLATNDQSNNPGGSYEGVPGAVDEEPYIIWTLLRALLTSEFGYRGVSIGALCFVLGIVAMLVARNRYAMPFFAGSTLLICFLSLGDTPVHRALYIVVPYFESFHAHAPRRILWMSPIGPAMLAGIGLQMLPELRDRVSWRWLVFVPLPLFIGADLFIRESGDVSFGLQSYGLAIGTTLILGLAMFLPRIPGFGISRSSFDRLIAISLICLVAAVPHVHDIARSLNDPDGLTQPNNLWQHRPSIEAGVETNVSRTDPGGAGEFLQQQGDLLQPFRYVGYSGRGYEPDPSKGYPDRRVEEPVMAILTNGRPFRLEVQTIQGYNPLQLGVWSDWMSELNRYAQNYHYTDLLPGGAQSPMLDMLNVRYIVIDASIPADRADIVTMTAGRTEVFRNDRVVIYENPESYQRGWIVHDVRQAPGEEAMRLINDGQVNGRFTAFVEGELPPFQPLDPATSGRATGETANVTAYEADAMTFQTSARTDGFLVISEVYEEGWKAYVDGVETEVYQTNHALRGVPIPAGEHTVELRYESDELRYGMVISGVFIVAAVGVGSAAGFVGWRDRRLAGASAGAGAGNRRAGESRWRVPGALGRLRRRSGPLPDA